MALDAAAVAWLRAAEAQEAAQGAADALASGVSLLSLIDRLRLSLNPDQVRWVVTLADGRNAAHSKFADASHLYFDRESAEQATSAIVAAYTARRFAGATRIADLGCGAGADALALAEQAPVVAVDLDPGRVAMAEANAAVRDVPVHAIAADLLHLTPGRGVLEGIDAAWFDPGRRDTSGRVLDPRRWTPPLREVLRIAHQFPRAGIKVAPGIDHVEVPDDAELEFISLDGSLVEAVIWLGTAVTAKRRATALPSGVSIAGMTDRGATPVLPPGAYLYDLDPSVGRAGLVDVLAPDLDAWLISPGVAYLSGNRAIDHPFARRFRIIQSMAFSERRLRDACVDAGAGRVEVMRRASPVDTNAIEHRLNRALTGSGDRVLTIALTRLDGEHAAILCERERPR
ncbi:MAG: methyltransferase domain-containing protein [Chloroflexi bacterium]|nr:methyltransferase domain-containing protein [Chloroflexota bacterium]